AEGPKEGVLVAWGFTAEGERVLLSVMLGMRESHEDWQALGRDLIARGLGAPMLIVADGAPGLIKAVEQAGLPQTASTAPSTACATCSPSCPNANASECARPTGRRSTRPPTNATESNGSRPWSTSSKGPATPPPPNAWPMTLTRSSCTCATRPGTAEGGAQPTCSKGRWARSNAAPR
ncbi:MAG: transposase, partial [Thermoleophilaceae bacterium]|nr:transposase [Thermoleophilaceae bacterium]